MNIVPNMAKIMATHITKWVAVTAHEESNDGVTKFLIELAVTNAFCLLLLTPSTAFCRRRPSGSERPGLLPVYTSTSMKRFT